MDGKTTIMPFFMCQTLFAPINEIWKWALINMSVAENFGVFYYTPYLDFFFCITQKEFSTDLWT